MTISSETQKLIEAREFDKIESLWIEQMQADPSDVDGFVETAHSLRKADERQLSDTLLDLLADALKDRALWPQRLRVLKEMGRLSKKPALLRQPIEEALKQTYATHPGFKRVFDFVAFGDPASNPAEKAEKIETWLSYDEGECFFMTGRGVGVVTELNPSLGICRLDFEKDKRISVPLGAAQKFLVPLPEGHLLRRKISSRDELRAFAVESPSKFFAELLKSFNRPMAVSDVRDAVIGIVPEEKWNSWWTAARKNQQIVISGSGAKAVYSWNASTDAADQVVRKDFDQAVPKDKLELARKHSSRSSELADYFSSRLALEAEKLSKSDPSKAWEIFAVLEKLPGKFDLTLDSDSLLSGPMAARVVAGIGDRLLREKALRLVRNNHADWVKIYGEYFFLEEDPRILTSIMDALAEAGQMEMRDRLNEETLRYARRHPKAFFWYCKTANESEKLTPRANFSLLQQMLDALSSDEFSPVRARMKDFFDRGKLAVRIITQALDEEQARKLVETLERYGSLEEYRRENLRGAAVMKFPSVREPQVETIFATPESLSAKRDEFNRLKSVEIPANLKAIQEARELGDLRENFEYKAARQRQEYLSARISQLQTELNQVRVLDSESVDISEVRVGTRVVVSNGDVRRDVTILGPWESSPEHGIYSNQSDIAKSMLGRKVGDIVSWAGNDYVVESIDRWK